MLEGAYNFRDLGGLRNSDGHHLRYGRVFRSDTLQALTPRDAQRLYEELGVRGVVDLRLADEVRTEGRGPLADFSDIRYANVPLCMAATKDIPAEEVMRELYLGCLAPEAHLGSALQHLCDMAEQPVVFHCAAGKDRTGILAAVLLRLLDVTDSDILEDYMKSAPAMPRMIERFATWPRYRDHMADTPHQVYDVEPSPLVALLHALDHQHAGVLGWGRSQKLSMSSIHRLRALLLT